MSPLSPPKAPMSEPKRPLRPITRHRRWASLFALSALLAAPTLACDEEGLATPHPQARLDFPTAISAESSGDRLWVVSGNFALAYRGAAVLAIDPKTNQFIPELAFEIGEFPGPLQLFERDGELVSAYITSRARDALYTVQFEDQDGTLTPTCPEGHRAAEDSILRCPRQGAITDLPADPQNQRPALSIGTTPYGLALQPSTGPALPDLLFVGAMEDGILSTLSLDEDGHPTLIGNIELSEGLFDLATQPGTQRLYASSQQHMTVENFDIRPRAKKDDPHALDPTNPFLHRLTPFTIDEPAGIQNPDRGRSIAFSADGKKLYLTYRNPNSLIVLDASDAPTRGRIIQKIALNRSPNELLVHTDRHGEEKIFLTSLSRDTVEVIDPLLGDVIASIPTGRGPSSLALIDRPDLGIYRLYVTLFHEDSVAVIELDPTSPFYHQVIGEIR